MLLTVVTHFDPRFSKVFRGYKNGTKKMDLNSLNKKIKQKQGSCLKIIHQIGTNLCCCFIACDCFKPSQQMSI